MDQQHSAGVAPASGSVQAADSSRTPKGQMQTQASTEELMAITTAKVEDLPLDKKLEVLKKHNYMENYNEGRFIDAQDTVNAWCLSQIVEVDQRMLRIHYDGWSSKWDMNVKINNYKLAPFRKFSKGYTGQQKVALRQNMKFSLDDLNLEKQRVQRLIDSDLNGLGAFETTQYLRGQLFIYVDFLLQGGLYTSEIADAINDFINHVLRLIVIWLKKIPKLIPLYAQIKVNSDLYLIDENIAILLSAYELIDILRKIFCGCIRCYKYYLLNDKAAVEFEKGVTQQFDHINFEQNNKKDEEEIDIDQIKETIAGRKGIVFGQFLNFLNYFAELGGFDAMIDALKAGNEAQEDRMPLDMIALLVQPFRTCNTVFAPTFIQKFTGQVKDILQNRLSNMTEKELKEIDKESVTRVLQDLKEFFTLSMTEVETAQLIEMNQLNMAFRFLKSTYLEKRLKGISDIKNMIERTEAAQHLLQRKALQGKTPGIIDYDIIGGKAIRPPKYITTEILKEWILSQKLLEIVFGENTHLEIVKRSGCILKFLAKEQALPEESIDLLWKCQLNKHEEMVRVVYSTIQELVPSIDVNFVDLFYSRIQQVPQSQFDDKFLEFLKEFSLKALENYFKWKSHECQLAENVPTVFEETVRTREVQIIQNIRDYVKNPSKWETDDKQYGLPIFWELIQDRATLINQELTQQSIKCLTQILKQTYSQPVKISFLLRSIDNILKGDSVAQSVVVAQSIIYDYANVPGNELSISDIIVHLQDQLGLVKAVIQNIEQYHDAVKEKARALSEKKKALPEDINNFVFLGKHTHEATLNWMLEFLEFLILASDDHVSLGTENIDRLWRLFVQQPNFNSDQSLFLKWINKHREQQVGPQEKRETFLFNDEERKHFFTKILCNPTYVDFQRISIGQVKSFHKFFKVINGEEGFINHQPGGKRINVRQHSKLIGLDTLKRIAVETENERSREESMDLLVDLHLKFDNQVVTMEEQQQIWANFIDQCMQQLESENTTLVSNTLQLLSKFLDRYEGKKTLKPEMKQSHFSNFQPVPLIVILRPDMIKKQVQISYFQTAGHLRVKIADAFGYQINEFHMVIKNQFIDPDEDDDRYMRDFGLIQQVIIQKNQHYNPANHPKGLISKKQENYDKLFTLLSKDTKSHLIEQTWDLLQKLPVNSKLQQEIKDLSGMNSMQDNKANWERILDSRSVNKLLYSLQIVRDLQSTNKKDPKVGQWRFKFIQMGGWVHLLRTFLSLNLKSIETNLTLKCIDLLISTLNEILMTDREKEQDQYAQNIQMMLDKKEQVVQTCIRLVDLISEYNITLEKKRGESYEDINKRIFLNKQKKNKYKSYMAQTTKGQDTKQEEEEDQESQEYSQMQQIIKQFSESNSIVTSLFKFMQFTVFMHDKSAAVIVAGYENLPDMLMKSTVVCENFQIRNEVLKRVKDILRLRSGSPDMQKMIKIVDILAFKIQPLTKEYENRCFQYYDGLTTILEELSPQDLESLKEPFHKLILDLTKFIHDREIKEKNTHDTDNLLGGKMNLLKVLLQKFPQHKQPVGELLTYHLVHNCLFESSQGGTSLSKARPPKCKSQSSRSNAMGLLGVLCRDCTSNLQIVLNYLTDFNHNPSWRTNKDLDWNISLMDSEKSSTGYVGLKNLGCICYMNSLFQQLFMIQSLRNDILAVKDNSTVEKDENMLYQLQLLFAGLQKSEKQCVSPKGFCHAFKDWEGNPTNVLEQMDVEEFFNMLMDRIETAVKGSQQQHTIQNHFGGKFASEMICKGCPHKYERSEPFLSLSISVKNQKSIQQSLNAFIQGEMLEGDNAYLCEKCDKKVDTLKRTCIKKLPKYLIIALRRFEFDYDKMVRVKVNDYCEFPMDLNLEPYTQEGLSKRERIQKLKEEKGEDEAQAMIEEIENEPLKYPQEYYEYSLSGIVVHSGTADSGHYYSFIKDREHADQNKWYEMNDHIVRDFDPNDIPQECFGGEDVYTGYNMMQIKTMKWRNAYLLFYERKVPVDINSDEEGEKTQNTPQAVEKNISSAFEDVEMQTVSTNAVQQTHIASEIEQKIIYENQKYWQNRFLFGNEYLDFVYDLALYWNTENIVPRNYLTKNNDFHLTGYQCPPEYKQNINIPEALDVPQPIDPAQIDEFELRVFKFATSFYLTILQRSAQKMMVPQMLNLLKAYINKSERCAAWLIREFCNYQIIEENFFQCSVKDIRKLNAGLLYCAMLKIYPLEKDSLLQYWEDPSQPQNNQTNLGNFTLILTHLIFEAKRFVANASQFFQLFARLSSLGPEMREFMLKGKIVGRLMEFFFDDYSPHKEYFRDMTNIVPIVNEQPDIGLPTQIDRKQMNQFQELLEKKRMRALAEGIAKYKYLFETVSNLMRSFQSGDANGQRSPYQTDTTVNFQGILQQEKDLYFPDSKFLKMPFSQAKKNRAMVALSKGYIHYAWNDMEQYNELINVVQLGLQEYDYNDIKPFLCLLQFMLTKVNNSNPQEQRFERTMSAFIECIEANQNYYKFMETIFEFIFKLTSAVPHILLWFHQNRDKLQWLQQWTQQITYPLGQTMATQGDNNLQASIRLLKKRNTSYHQYPTYFKNEAYKNNFVRMGRNERIRLLFEGKNSAMPNELELSLIDMEDYKFKVGDQIEIYNRKTDQLNQVQVEEVLDEMLKVRYLNYTQEDQYGNQRDTQWIGCDSDKLQPLGTFKNQIRVKYAEHFETQHENRIRAQQQQSANAQGGQMRGAVDGDQEMSDSRGGSNRGNNNYNQNHYGDAGGGGSDDDDDNESSNDDLYS